MWLWNCAGTELLNITQGNTTCAAHPWDKLPPCRGKCRATLAEVQPCEEHLGDKMFYMLLFLPTPPILSYIPAAEIPMSLLWEGTSCSQWCWWTGPFLRTADVQEHEQFIPISAVLTICPVWAGHRKAAPRREVTPGCGQLGNGEGRGEHASQPHITSTSPSPELANVSICIEFYVRISD